MKNTTFYLDLFHLTMGYTSLYYQIFYGPTHLASEIVMVLVVLVCLVKTFMYMKVIEQYSVIVTMLTNVLLDLGVFLTFYMILMLFLSQVFTIIVPSNQKNI